MASSECRKGEYYTPGTAIHPPSDRDQRSAQNDHARNCNPRNGQRKPELLQDLGNLLEEVTPLHFLGGGAPGDVQRKHMGKDGNAHGNREASEEEKEERNPLDVLEERPKEFLMPQPVFQKGECQRARSKEYDGSSQPDLEAVHVEVFYRKLESKEGVVYDTDCE